MLPASLLANERSLDPEVLGRPVELRGSVLKLRRGVHRVVGAGMVRKAVHVT